MWAQAAAVAGLGILCGGWVVLQRWIAHHDPGQPGVEDRCGSCGVGRRHVDHGKGKKVVPRR
jgi:hypothetical protein